jgi:YkoY family integral membrane protein
MDTAALPSLTDWLDGVDHLGELLPLLPVLVSLELLLSADNAIALAAIARKQSDPALERRALNLGVLMAFVLRVALILMAQWVLAFPPIQLLAGGYLLWLCYQHWRPTDLADDAKTSLDSAPTVSFRRTVITLAVTDLAFSIDSVAAAVAISDQLLLVITGALIGVVALRFTSGLFIHWLKIYSRLESAGYLAVAFVGFKLLIQLVFPMIDVPELLTLSVVALLMVWGFSIRLPLIAEET